MDLDSTLRIVGIAAVSILALGWLVVSFARSASVQSRLAWIATCALYLALAVLFTNLCRRAWHAENWFVLAAFGLLLGIFLGGFAVSLVKTVRAFWSAGASGEHATH
jgi:hypothetical protein